MAEKTRKRRDENPSEELDVRAELLSSLMDRVREDTYPSPTHLDMIEELLTPAERPEYCELLLERINEDQFPSIPMLARLKKFA